MALWVRARMAVMEVGISLVVTVFAREGGGIGKSVCVARECRQEPNCDWLKEE